MPWIAAWSLVAILALSGIAPYPAAMDVGYPSGGLNDPAILTAVYANRSGVPAAADDTFEDLLYPYAQFADDATVSRIAKDDEKPPRVVMLQAAEEDVRFLFEMYKYGFALYQAFGGDEVFPKARDRILQVLPGLAEPDGSIRVSSFRNAILENLTFIQDGHTSFAGKPLFTHYDWFYNDRYVFRKDDGGFYTSTHSIRLFGLIPVHWAGAKQYLIAVDGRPPKDSLVLSLTADGELVYVLSRVEASPHKRLTVHLALRNDLAESEVRVSLCRDVTEVLPGFDLEPFYSRTPYRLEIRGGIPVVTNRSAVPAPTADERALEQFVADASTLRANDIVILDLRHHEGGQLEYPLRWTQAFMGTTFSFENRWAELATRTSVRLHHIFAERYYAGNDEKLGDVATYFGDRTAYLDAHPEAVADAWSIEGQPDRQPALLPNPRTLFVLIDENTGSAGEEFVGLLRQFENVIFVGEKTEGLMTSGSPGEAMLPNSRLPFNFPIGFFPARVREGLEGIGYCPDIWVEPGQALTRVLRYIASRTASS